MGGILGDLRVFFDVAEKLKTQISLISTNRYGELTQISRLAVGRLGFTRMLSNKKLHRDTQRFLRVSLRINR